MPMPRGYEETVVQNHESFPVLKPGGHKCAVMAIKIMESRAGNRMMILDFDCSTEDEQALYYTERYKRDKSNNPDTADWKGRYRCVIDEHATDKNGKRYGLQNLKQVMTAIEDSNPGFKVNWDPYGANDEYFCSQFKGVKIGVVFREEEYVNSMSNVAVSIKPMYCCNYATVLEHKVPKKKELPEGSAPQTEQFIPRYRQQGMVASTAEGYMSVDPLDDAGLPFD